MKINEIEVIKEDYPGLALSLNSNIGRAIQAVKIAAQDPESKGRSFAQWTAEFYRQGKNMDKPGQAAVIDYLVRTARQNGWNGSAPDISLKATQGAGTPSSQIFKKVATFYETELAEILDYIPEISDQDKAAIRKRISQINYIGSPLEKQATAPRTKPDDSAEYNDGSNQLRGTQNSAAMQAVNGAIDQVAQKYGKDAAHQLRQKVAKSGNPLLGLQTELAKAGMTLSESVMQRLKEQAEKVAGNSSDYQMQLHEILESDGINK